MRMVEGPTLKELIQRQELGDRRALRLLTQVAEALDAAHEQAVSSTATSSPRTCWWAPATTPTSRTSG